MSADVLVVSLATTGGWRAAAAELAGAVERAGASVAVVEPAPVADVRTFMLTDFVQARAARAAAIRGLAAVEPRAVIYCSITAALLWPRPGAIWFDSLAAENRPGRHGLWQRAVERRRLARAPVAMAMSLGAIPGAGRDSVVVPVPVEPSGSPVPAAARDVDALVYAADPVKKRLAFVLAAWAAARRDGETLWVAGLDALPAGAPGEGVRVAGRLAPAEYRALVRRTRVFVAAPIREDYGIAPLEALADGCRLVTTAARGPYPAFALARALDPRLACADDGLAAAIRVALDDPAPGYARRAAERLGPFRRAAVDQVIADRVLPALLRAPAAG